jgi:O-antigen/teichoic acid export membrane protein
VAILPLLTRVLPIEAFGQVSLAIVTIPLFALAVGVGLPAAITRQSIIDAAGFAGARGLHAQAAGISGLLCLLACAVVLASPGTAIDAFFGGTIATVLTIASAGLGAVVLSAQSYLRAADRVRPFVLSALIAGPVGAALGLAVTIVVEPTADYFLAGLLVGYGAAAATATWAVLRGGRIVRSLRGLVAALRIGAPTIPHSLALGLAAGGLVLVAGAAGNLELAAESRVVIAVATGAGLLVASLNNAWAPAIYRTRGAELEDVLVETSRTMAWIAAVSGGLVAAVSPWVVRVLAPPEYDYAAMASAIAIASISPLLQVAYLSSAHLVFVRGRTLPLAFTSPAAVGIGLLASTALIPVAGLNGIAVAYLLTFAVLAALTYLVSAGATPARWRPEVLALPAVVLVSTCLLPLAPVPPTLDVALRLGAVGLLLAIGVVGAARLRRSSAAQSARVPS